MVARGPLDFDADSCGAKSGTCEQGPLVDAANRGKLQPIASRILMKVPWAARIARYDLFRAVGHLATYVSRWTSTQDRQLDLLMSYSSPRNILR